MSTLEMIARNFQKIQVLFLLAVLFLIWTFFKNNRSQSNFKTREADREDLDRILKPGPDLAQAKLRRKPPETPPHPPLALPGIRLEGAPHEILGVREDASETDILRAYKDAIKRFHPDTLQGKSEEQLRFYQEASARINDAKNQMLKRIRET
ncbi:MAG: J domain-containing protein [Bdellovibrionales bacterium]|nr:J domain-containing protein [Bdellovibrionales bacterium]